MILTTHAVVGAALASFVPSHPAAAFVLGFGSHFNLDAIPHVDYPIKSRSVNPRIGRLWRSTEHFFRTPSPSALMVCLG